MDVQSIILAAGQGVRMHSKLPKILHPLLGKPLVFYAIEAAEKVTHTSPLLVIGHGAEAVRQTVGERVRYVLQEQQLGTAHAVQQAMPLLKDGPELILVTYGDMPLLTSETLQHLIQTQQQHCGPITMLTVQLEDAHGFGRVIRSANGNVQAIVEEAQATPQQLKINELNVGVYCFSRDWLLLALPQVPLSPKGEYYLTDLIGLAVAQGLSVAALTLAEPHEAIGVNNRLHLAEAAAILRRRINRHWMLNGVTLEDPDTITIEPEVQIGQDTIIAANTHLRGKTTIGEDCIIGPNTIIEDSQIGNRCQVFASVLEQAKLEDGVDVGPFSHLRKGAHCAQGVHIGNFGEIKQSYLGPHTKMGHFSYIGDATIGANVNIGCGTITCNYDGTKKNHTEIGDEVFLGSDTMLVAPIKMGKGARTGAGAVVTRDIPENALAIGVPARIKNINISE